MKLFIIFIWPAFLFISATDLAAYPDLFGVLKKVPIVLQVITNTYAASKQTQTLNLSDYLYYSVPDCAIPNSSVSNGPSNNVFYISLKYSVQPGTLSIQFTGVPSAPGRLIAIDDRQGNLIGVGIAYGSINYDTGDIILAYISSPSLNQEVIVKYNLTTQFNSIETVQSMLGGNTGY